MTPAVPLASAWLQDSSGKNSAIVCNFEDGNRKSRVMLLSGSQSCQTIDGLEYARFQYSHLRQLDATRSSACLHCFWDFVMLFSSVK